LALSFAFVGRLALLLAFPVGCGGHAQPPDILLVCDDTTSARCDEQSIRKAALSFLKKPIPGGRITVLTVGCGSDEAEAILQITVPLSWGSGAAEKRRAWQEIEGRHLDDLRLRRPQRCSAIIGTIWRGSRMLQESTKPVKEMLIDSDLREASPESGLNFERAIPTPEAFVQRIRERGLLPDLRGIRVIVYHVHDDQSPDSRRWTSQQAVALRAAWAAAFKAMGVENIEFRSAAPWEESDRTNLAWSGQQ
jgi:hypothetical protein